MQKIIKLSDEHYIGIDDSEIKDYGTWFYNLETKLVGQYFQGEIENYWKKITHSTQPLGFLQEEGITTANLKHDWGNVKPLSLSEVEEAMCGYSVEKMGAELAYKRRIKYQSQYEDGVCSGLEEGYISGFKAHQELVKDKLFTIEDMVNAHYNGWIDRGEADKIQYPKARDVFKQSLLPKTEWDCCISDGKLLLL